MKAVTLTALLALAACSGSADNASAPAAAPVAAAPAPQGTDWTATVAATPEGGFRMGNPNAAIKVVEYGSLTCPHCAAFSAEGMEPLKAKYIATGKVSYEFRSFLLHGQDLMATMLVGCGGPEPFFGLLEAAYANQEDWLGKLIALPPAELTRLQALPVAEQNVALAKASGLDAFVVQRGIPAADAQRCLTDAAAPDKLLKQRDTATSKFEVAGTPTFIINGATAPDTASWSALEAKLRAAGA